MVKIYTKKGDEGTTSIVGGGKLAKNSARIEAYGNVDELNSVIGTTLFLLKDKKLIIKLARVQSELFVLGSDLATPIELRSRVKGLESRTPRISAAFTKRLEKEIDGWEKKLPPLANFVLPGGGELGSQFHLVRTVARRAERAIVTLSEKEKINGHVLPYINRLSDWLFVLARFINNLEEEKETLWKGRK